MPRDTIIMPPGTFEAIDAKYGSADACLEKEAGMTAADLAALRANYLQ